MKIAILTSGILPVPAIRGGAVENLVDFYLAYNEVHRQHDITVYSVGDRLTKGHHALQSEVNHYHYIEVNTFLSKIRKHIYKTFHGEGYYDYTIEYFLTQSLKDIRRKDYDLIIIENRAGYILKVASQTHAKTVLHLHNDFLHKDSREAKAIYDAFDRIITVSDYITSRVRTIRPNDGKCVTVENGIDINAFSRLKAKPRTRKSLGLQSTDFVLVYSGRINREKGIAQLIQAMCQLTEYKDIKLLVMGSSFYGGPDAGQDPFIHQLKESASPIRERVVFTGFIPYNDMPSYLQLADCSVIPSQWEEPFGLTCVEAMAMGLPIIAARSGGIPEILSSDNAILLQKGENFVDQLSAAILDLYRHREKCLRMGEASLKLSRNYSKQHYAESFMQALSSTLNT